MNIDDDKIQEYKLLLTKKEVKSLLGKLEDYLDGNANYPGFYERVHTLSIIYDGVSSAFRKGLKDTSRDEMYQSVCDGLEQVLKDMEEYILRTHNSVLCASVKRSSMFDITAFITSDYTKLGNQERYDAYQVAFSHFLTLPIKNEEQAKKVCDMVCGKSNDFILSCLMVSAIMSSCLYFANKYKLTCLWLIYQNCSDRKIRQRAFVGMVMGFCISDDEIRNHLIQEWKKGDDSFKHDLVELQKQMILCLQSERDSDEINEELMKNFRPQNLANKIITDDFSDSPLDDIIYPQKSEELTEKVEESISKMMDMEKKGSDVYFGGFSKMKKFAFFHSMVNWFIPFYLENPSLQKVAETFGDNSLLKAIKESSPFCESDRYSFAFGLSETMNTFGAKLKPLLSGNVMFTRFSFLDDESMVDIWERRNFLQDLFRFFRLSSFTNGMHSPFNLPDNDTSNCLFVMDERLVNDVVGLDGYLNVCKFATKNKAKKIEGYLYEKVDKFVSSEKVKDTKLSEVEKELILLCNSYFVSRSNYAGALERFEKWLPLMDGQPKMYKLYAKCLYGTGKYKEAADLYERIVAEKPTKSSMMALAYSYLNIGEVEKAIKLLFQIEYNDPNNLDVMRALGWAMLLRGDAPKSLDFLKKFFALTKDSSHVRYDEDYYNMGLSYWFNNDMDHAVKCFAHYSNIRSTEDLNKKFSKDLQLLAKHGKMPSDYHLMVELVEENG